MHRGPEYSQDIYTSSSLPAALEDPIISESNDVVERKKSSINVPTNHHGGNENPFLRQMQEVYTTPQLVKQETTPSHSNFRSPVFRGELHFQNAHPELREGYEYYIPHKSEDD